MRQEWLPKAKSQRRAKGCQKAKPREGMAWQGQKRDQEVVNGSAKTKAPKT